MKLDFPNFSTLNSDPKIADLGMLSVRPDYTELGLASELMEFVEAKAKENDYLKVRL